MVVGTLTAGVRTGLPTGAINMAAANFSPAVVFSPPTVSHRRAVTPPPVPVSNHPRAVSPTAGNTNTPPHVHIVRSSSTGDVMITNQKQ